MTDQTVIEMVILFVSTGRGEMITEDTIIAASRELETVWKHISELRKTLMSDQKIMVWFLDEVGTALITREWRKPASICENVERIYKRWRDTVPAKIIEPFLVTTSYSKPSDPVPKVNFKQYQRIKGQYPITQPIDPGPSERVDALTDYYLKMKEGGEEDVDGIRGELYWQTINNPSFLVRRSTQLSDASSINDIVEAFRVVFHNEWRTTFETCMSAYNNYHTAIFLSHVVKNIYDVVMRTATARKVVQKQRRDAIKSIEILQSLDKSSTRSQRHDTSPPEVSIPLQYIKQNYFETQLRHSLIKYKINSTSCVADVELYAARCVEVCWYMCNREPPIHLDFALDNESDTVVLFQPFTFPGGRNTNRTTRVVIWPALRLNKGGLILDKGWTMNF